MKTIFVSFTLKNSSVAEFFVEISNQLSRNYKVIIITYASEKNDLIISPEITIFKWPSKRPTGIKDFLFLIKMIYRFRPKAMISSFGSVNLFLCVGFLMNIKHRIAWYHTLSSQLQNDKLLQLRKRVIYKFATRIIANSKATKFDLVNNFGVKKNKVNVVYNAVKIPKIKDETNRFKLVYAGRMDPIKGVDVMLQALPSIINEFPLVHLTLIGDDLEGNQVKLYREKANSLKIQNSVTFTGNKSKEFVLNQFSSACLTIVPSISEAFGYVIIESFSVRTPVVGSRTSGIMEIIRDGKDGLLFEVNNHQELAKKVNEVLGNPILRDKLSNSCWRRFKKEFEVRNKAKLFIKDLENDLVAKL